MALTKFDSFNIYPGASNLTPFMPWSKREDIFINHILTEPLPDVSDLIKQIPEMDYIIIAHSFSNQQKFPEHFHDKTEISIARLAAITANTPLYGTLMTDIDDQSTKYRSVITQENINNLLKHLDDLGVSKTACLIAVGEIKDAFAKYLSSNRYYFGITDYRNNNWNYARVQTQISTGISNYTKWRRHAR